MTAKVAPPMFTVAVRLEPVAAATEKFTVRNGDGAGGAAASYVDGGHADGEETGRDRECSDSAGAVDEIEHARPV